MEIFACMEMNKILIIIGLALVVFGLALILLGEIIKAILIFINDENENEQKKRSNIFCRSYMSLFGAKFITTENYPPRYGYYIKNSHRDSSEKIDPFNYVLSLYGILFITPITLYYAWQGVLVVAIGIGLLFLARMSVRQKKLMNEHINDKSKHN